MGGEDWLGIFRRTRRFLLERQCNFVPVEPGLEFLAAVLAEMGGVGEALNDFHG